MLTKIKNYFKSPAFWAVIAVGTLSYLSGLGYDSIFGEQYPTRNWQYFSDMTSGDWITVGVGMGFILLILIVQIGYLVVNRGKL